MSTTTTTQTKPSEILAEFVEASRVYRDKLATVGSNEWATTIKRYDVARDAAAAVVDRDSVVIVDDAVILYGGTVPVVIFAKTAADLDAREEQPR